MENLTQSKQKVAETLSKLITGIGEGKITVESIRGNIPDILETFDYLKRKMGYMNYLIITWNMFLIILTISLLTILN
jgi:hypothetical protein